MGEVCEEATAQVIGVKVSLFKVPRGVSIPIKDWAHEVPDMTSDATCFTRKFKDRLALIIRLDRFAVAFVLGQALEGKSGCRKIAWPFMGQKIAVMGSAKPFDKCDPGFSV